ncbi:hypothetical protein [Streptomyces sp. NBC_00459]|uniref:hypothetical protein n=1 Tax=Streptomyces sp. NBC_00459 TaxID=2975749 RepID=UPI002E174C51
MAVRASRGRLLAPPVAADRYQVRVSRGCGMLGARRGTRADGAVVGRAVGVLRTALGTARPPTPEEGRP